MQDLSEDGDDDGGSSINQVINELAAMTIHDIGKWSQIPSTNLIAGEKVITKRNTRPQRNAESVNSMKKGVTDRETSKNSKKMSSIISGNGFVPNIINQPPLLNTTIITLPPEPPNSIMVHIKGYNS
jgi:hypothetical protein